MKTKLLNYNSLKFTFSWFIVLRICGRYFRFWRFSYIILKYLIVFHYTSKKKQEKKQKTNGLVCALETLNFLLVYYYLECKAKFTDENNYIFYISTFEFGTVVLIRVLNSIIHLYENNMKESFMAFFHGTLLEIYKYISNNKSEHIFLYIFFVIYSNLNKFGAPLKKITYIWMLPIVI